MKISRSKVVEIIFTLALFVLIIVYAFLFSNNQSKTSDNYYVYNKDNNEKENEVMNEETEIETDGSLEEEILDPVVYENMTLEQLSNKLENSLNSNISGYGNFIASYSLEKGIDPYLATAIMLHETGCTWECSSLVKKCNNVGGMKGSGCGSYGYFNSLEEGIQRFIDNIYNNYYAYGLVNADLMGSKYAEDPDWSKKVNRHIENIKNR